MDSTNSLRFFPQSYNQEKSDNNLARKTGKLVETNAFLDQAIEAEAVCAFHFEQPNQTADNGQRGNVYLCNFCSYSVPNIGLILDHVKQHRFKCGICEFITFSRAEIFHHKKNAHEEWTKDHSRNPVYVCSLVEKQMPVKRELEIQESDEKQMPVKRELEIQESDEKQMPVKREFEIQESDEKQMPVKRELEIQEPENLTTYAHEMSPDDKNTFRNLTQKSEQEPCEISDNAHGNILDLEGTNGNHKIQNLKLEEASANVQKLSLDKDFTLGNSILKVECEDEESWEICVNPHYFSGDDDDSDKDIEIKIEKPEENSANDLETGESLSSSFSLQQECTETMSESMCLVEASTNLPKVQSNQKPNTSMIPLVTVSNQLNLKSKKSVPIQVEVSNTNTSATATVVCENVQDKSPLKQSNTLLDKIVSTDTSTIKLGNECERTKLENMYWRCAYCLFCAAEKVALTYHLQCCHAEKSLQYVQETVSMILERILQRCSKNSPKHTIQTNWYCPSDDTLLKCGCCNYYGSTVAAIKEHMLRKHLGEALYALDFRAKFTCVYFCLKEWCCFATQNSAVYDFHTSNCVGKKKYKYKRLQQLFYESVHKSLSFAGTDKDTSSPYESAWVKYYCCPYCDFCSAEQPLPVINHISSKHSGNEERMTVFNVEEKTTLYDVYFCSEKSSEKDKIDPELSNCQNMKTGKRRQQETFYSKGSNVSALVANTVISGNILSADITNTVPSGINLSADVANTVHSEDNVSGYFANFASSGINMSFNVDSTVFSENKLSDNIANTVPSGINLSAIVTNTVLSENNVSAFVANSASSENNVSAYIANVVISENNMSANVANTLSSEKNVSANVANTLLCGNKLDSDLGAETSESTPTPDESSLVQIADNETSMMIHGNESGQTQKEASYLQCEYCMFYTDEEDAVVTHINGCHGGRPIMYNASTVAMILQKLKLGKKCPFYLKYMEKEKMYNDQTFLYSAHEDTLLKCGCCSYCCSTVKVMKDHMLENHLGLALYALDFQAKFARVYFCLKKSCCFATQNSAMYELHTPRCFGLSYCNTQILQEFYSHSVYKTVSLASTIANMSNVKDSAIYYCCPYCAFYNANDHLALKMHIKFKHSESEKLMTVLSVKEKTTTYDLYFCAVCFQQSVEKEKVLCHPEVKHIIKQRRRSCRKTEPGESMVETSIECEDPVDKDSCKTDKVFSKSKCRQGYASNSASKTDSRPRYTQFVVEIFGFAVIEFGTRRYRLSAYKPFLKKDLLVDIIYPFVESCMPLDIRSSMSVETLNKYLDLNKVLIPCLYECITCGKILVGGQLMKQHLKEHDPAPCCAVDVLKYKTKEANYLITFCPVDNCDYIKTNLSSLRGHVNYQHGSQAEKIYWQVLHHDIRRVKKKWEMKTEQKPEDELADHSRFSETRSIQGPKRTGDTMEPLSTCNLSEICLQRIYPQLSSEKEVLCDYLEKEAPEKSDCQHDETGKSFQQETFHLKDSIYSKDVHLSANVVNTVLYGNVQDCETGAVNSESTLTPDESSPVQICDTDTCVMMHGNESGEDQMDVLYWKCEYCMFYTDDKEAVLTHASCHGEKPIKYVKATIAMILEELKMQRWCSRKSRYIENQKMNNETMFLYAASDDTVLKCGCCSYCCPTVKVMKDHMLKNHLGLALYALDFQAKFARVYFCLKKSCCFATQNSAMYELHTPRCLSYCNTQILQKFYSHSVYKTVSLASTIANASNVKDSAIYYCCPYCAFYNANDHLALKMHIKFNHSESEKMITVMSVKEKTTTYDLYFCDNCLQQSLEKDKVLCHSEVNDRAKLGGQRYLKRAETDSSGAEMEATVEGGDLVDKDSGGTDHVLSKSKSGKSYASYSARNPGKKSPDLQVPVEILGLTLLESTRTKYFLSAYKPFLEKDLLLDIIYPFVESHMPFDIRSSISIETLDKHLDLNDVLIPCLYECITCGKIIVGAQLMKHHLKEHNPVPCCAVDFLKHKKKDANFLITFCPVDNCDHIRRDAANLSNHVKKKHGVYIEEKHEQVLNHNFKQIKRQLEIKTGQIPEDEVADPNMVFEVRSNQGTKRLAETMEPSSTPDVQELPGDEGDGIVHHSTNDCNKRRKSVVIKTGK